MNDENEGSKTDGEEDLNAEQDPKNADGGSASEDEVDFKELLRLERERAEKLARDNKNYKTALKNRDAEVRRRREKEDENDDDTPITRKDLEETIKKVVAPIAEGNKIDGILSSMVADASKRELVKYYYEHRIVKRGTSDADIRSDIEEAIGLADSKRINKENIELKRMNDNRTYVPPNTGGGSQDKGTDRKPHQWTPEQEAALEARARNAGISDVEKFKAEAWKQTQAGSAFQVQRK